MGSLRVYCSMEKFYPCFCTFFNLIEYQIGTHSDTDGQKAAFIAALPLRWPDPSIVERSRRSREARASAILLRGRRASECRETDSLRAVVTERSANPNRQTPPARPEFEAGRST